MTPEERNAFIVRYMGLAEALAAKTIARAGGAVDPEDARSWAYDGLVRAVDHWDPTTGTPFEVYGTVYIRGAILDEQRRQDWAPKSLRARAKAVAAGDADAEETRRVEVELRQTHVSSLNATSRFSRSSGEDAVVEMGDMLPGRTVGPEDAARLSEIASVVVGVFDGLEPSSQAIIALHYYAGKTLREAAELMGIPESKATKVHRSVVLQIKGALGRFLARS